MATPMERAPDPGLEYVPIPKERYTSREFAGLEWEHMWTKTWLCAGRASDAPNAGDYFTFEVGPESVLVIRQGDGSLAARYNVCMHRGNRLREAGRGHAEKFSCLFHGWEYGIDGTLQKALDAECFPQGIDSKKLSLQPVLCDTWAGFVFVCFDAKAAPLRDYLGVIPEHLDPYHFEDWKVSYDCTIEIECNWKTCVDAFNEAYHLSATHAWTIEFSDDVNTLYDCYDKHTRMIFPEVQASPRHPGAGTVTPGIKEMFLEARRYRCRRVRRRTGRGASCLRRADQDDRTSDGCRRLRTQRVAALRRFSLHDLPEHDLQYAFAVHMGLHSSPAPYGSEQDVLRLHQLDERAEPGCAAARERILSDRRRRYPRRKMRRW